MPGVLLLVAVAAPVVGRLLRDAVALLVRLGLPVLLVLVLVLVLLGVRVPGLLWVALVRVLGLLLVMRPLASSPACAAS